ncbi:hypothetical protein [Eubacterium sp.]|uniref:hypothetical protein n=1 Tax=Eubacterium sp. TaxID=142586 RepID=UPI002FC8FF66
MIKSYVHKPSIVQAMQWDGISVSDMSDFCVNNAGLWGYQLEINGRVTPTMNDKKLIKIGDYVVKDGETARVIRKHEFEQMYELLD